MNAKKTVSTYLRKIKPWHRQLAYPFPMATKQLAGLKVSYALIRVINNLYAIVYIHQTFIFESRPILLFWVHAQRPVFDGGLLVPVLLSKDNL